MVKNIFFAAWAVILIGCSGSFAQTVKEFQARYGKPIEVYEIRPGILLYPKFDADGRLIEARIQRSIATGSTIYLDSELPDDQLVKILNELVPPERRGTRSDLSGLLVVVGPGGTQSDDYENVSITRYFSAGHGKKLSFSGTMAIVVELKPSFYQQK
jgi:hypothetical protein